MLTMAFLVCPYIPWCIEFRPNADGTNDYVDYVKSIPPCRMMLLRIRPRLDTNCTIHAMLLGPT